MRVLLDEHETTFNSSESQKYEWGEGSTRRQRRGKQDAVTETGREEGKIGFLHTKLSDAGE